MAEERAEEKVSITNEELERMLSEAAARGAREATESLKEALRQEALSGQPIGNAYSSNSPNSYGAGPFPFASVFSPINLAMNAGPGAGSAGYLIDVYGGRRREESITSGKVARYVRGPGGIIIDLEEIGKTVGDSIARAVIKEYEKAREREEGGRRGEERRGKGEKEEGERRGEERSGREEEHDRSSHETGNQQDYQNQKEDYVDIDTYVNNLIGGLESRLPMSIFSGKIKINNLSVDVNGENVVAAYVRSRQREESIGTIAGISLQKIELLSGGKYRLVFDGNRSVVIDSSQRNIDGTNMLVGNMGKYVVRTLKNGDNEAELVEKVGNLSGNVNIELVGDWRYGDTVRLLKEILGDTKTTVKYTGYEKQDGRLGRILVHLGLMSPTRRVDKEMEVSEIDKEVYEQLSEKKPKPSGGRITTFRELIESTPSGSEIKIPDYIRLKNYSNATLKIGDTTIRISYKPRLINVRGTQTQSLSSGGNSQYDISVDRIRNLPNIDNEARKRVRRLLDKMTNLIFRDIQVAEYVKSTRQSNQGSQQQQKELKIPVVENNNSKIISYDWSNLNKYTRFNEIVGRVSELLDRLEDVKNKYENGLVNALVEGANAAPNSRRYNRAKNNYIKLIDSLRDDIGMVAFNTLFGDQNTGTPSKKPSDGEIANAIIGSTPRIKKGVTEIVTNRSGELAEEIAQYVSTKTGKSIKLSGTGTDALEEALKYAYTELGIPVAYKDNNNTVRASTYKSSVYSKYSMLVSALALSRDAGIEKYKEVLGDIHTKTNDSYLAELFIEMERRQIYTRAAMMARKTT